MFDSKPTRIQWRDVDGDVTQKSNWDNKLKMFRANGGTSPGTAIRAMMDHKPDSIVVDQVVVVTDEGENSSGVSFATMIRNYEKRVGLLPFVSIVRVASPYGKNDRMTRSCEAMGIEVDAIDCTNIDQISMPNLIQRLARQSMFDLVQEVVGRELPTRVVWDLANKMTPAEIKKGAAAVAVL